MKFIISCLSGSRLQLTDAASPENGR